MEEGLVDGPVPAGRFYSAGDWGERGRGWTMGACFVVWVLLVPFCRGACGSCALPAHWAAGVPAASEPAGRVSFLCVRGVKGVRGDLVVDASFFGCAFV